MGGSQPYLINGLGREAPVESGDADLIAQHLAVRHEFLNHVLHSLQNYNTSNSFLQMEK